MKPYVYKLTHKTTQQFYYGFRSANKLPAEEDLGFKYFSSSKTVKDLGFANFITEILAEFDSAKDAFDFETQLIRQHISHPLNLNKAIKGELFPSRKITTQEHRNNLSKALKGKKQSLETIEKSKKTRTLTISLMSDEERKLKYGKGSKQAQLTISKMSVEERSLKFGTMRGRKHSEETLIKIKNANVGRKHSEETKNRLSVVRKGKPQSAKHILARTKNFKNSGNPRAISVTINGTVYGCKKEARQALGWSKNKLKSYLTALDL